MTFQTVLERLINLFNYYYIIICIKKKEGLQIDAVMTRFCTKIVSTHLDYEFSSFRGLIFEPLRSLEASNGETANPAIQHGLCSEFYIGGKTRLSKILYFSRLIS